MNIIIYPLHEKLGISLAVVKSTQNGSRHSAQDSKAKVVSKEAEEVKYI